MDGVGGGVAEEGIEGGGGTTIFLPRLDCRYSLAHSKSSRYL